MESRYAVYDRDGNRKLTIDDRIPYRATVTIPGAPAVRARGPYKISNLAQELALREKSGLALDPQRVAENPVDRISRSISEGYWDGLTRRLDRSSFAAILHDPKVKADKCYLYVRGVPFVVPGGRFNELYGRDSYFHVLGTLTDGRGDLARGTVDNLVYEITHYGKILNANRTCYLTRLQPPFLGPERRTPLGLSRYGGFARGVQPEVEPGHFDHVLGPAARRYGLTIPELTDRLNQAQLRDPGLEEFFLQTGPSANPDTIRPTAGAWEPRVGRRTS